jgi:hypothetical protein
MSLEVSKKFYVVMGIISLAFALFLARIALMNRERADSLREGIDVTEVESYWSEKAASPVEVTMVPTFTFRVRNKRQTPLEYVQVSAIFAFVGESQALGDAFAYPIQSSPLAPGQVTEKVLLKCNFGYRASSKKAFLGNPAFKPVEVRLYAQSRSSGQVHIGTYPIARKLEGMPDPAPAPQNVIKIN